MSSFKIGALNVFVIKQKKIIEGVKSFYFEELKIEFSYLSRSEIRRFNFVDLNEVICTIAPFLKYLLRSKAAHSNNFES